jgi:hypothetical protein
MFIIIWNIFKIFDVGIVHGFDVGIIIIIFKKLFIRSSLLFLSICDFKCLAKLWFLAFFPWIWTINHIFPKRNHQTMKIHHQKKFWLGKGVNQLFYAEFSTNYDIFIFTKETKAKCICTTLE